MTGIWALALGVLYFENTETLRLVGFVEIDPD